jgi:protein SCO1
MLHALLLALTLVPVHGVVLDTVNGTAIVRTEIVPGMLPAQTQRYRLDPASRFRSGVGIDAFLDRTTRPWTLRDVHPAGPFSPGMPDPGRVIAMELGSPLPAAKLVDQNGRLVELDRAFQGKTLLLSFVFTRCPDRTLCPAISGKYAYMQSHLDPKHFALAEITLDPQYDSPAVLHRYGDAYGNNPSIWSLLTGTGSTLQRVLNEFRISSLRESTSNFIHDDKLYIVTPQGRVAYIVDTAGWDPQAAIEQARSVAGLASNPFERFKLSLIANVVAVCGGSQFAGVALLELSLFFFIVIIVAAGLWVVARVLWAKPSH